MIYDWEIYKPDPADTAVIIKVVVMPDGPGNLFSTKTCHQKHMTPNTRRPAKHHKNPVREDVSLEPTPHDDSRDIPAGLKYVF